MPLLPHLFGDITRLAILRLLERTRSGVSQRELARKIGRDPGHVHRVLQSLDAVGIVDAHSDPRAIVLVRDHPLHDPVTMTLDLFDRLELQTPLLRFVVRAAKGRFDDRFFIGGYQAAATVVQPIDFRSYRADLYVKRSAAKDRQWSKELARVTSFDVRLHAGGRFGEIQQGAVDGEACWMARPELGVVQCLTDADFPRYGAFLLLVQGIQEGAYQPDILTKLTDGTRYQTIIHNIIERVQQTGELNTESLDALELKALEDALETVEGDGA